MDLTQETLKQIIKEELEEMMHDKKMSRKAKLQKIVDLIMNDDIGLVGYPGSPDARQRLRYYGRQAGFDLELDDDIEQLKNSLIMSKGENFDRVARFLHLVVN